MLQMATSGTARKLQVSLYWGERSEPPPSVADEGFGIYIFL